MILVAGGSGRLGTLIVRRLAARSLCVRVLTRDRKRTAHLEPDGVEVIEGDVRERSSVDGAMVGVSTVVSAIHGFGDIGHVSPASVESPRINSPRSIGSSSLWAVGSNVPGSNTRR